jgi:hypothetical protein
MKYTNSIIPESLAKYLENVCSKNRECKAKIIIALFEHHIDIDELQKVQCNEKLKQAFYVPYEVKLKLYEIQSEYYKRHRKRVNQKVIWCYLKKFLETHDTSKETV